MSIKITKGVLHRLQYFNFEFDSKILIYIPNYQLFQGGLPFTNSCLKLLLFTVVFVD